MLGDDNSTAFLDNNALIGSGSDVPGFHTMARVTARAVVKAATATVTETETATETSVLREQIDFILDNEYSHLMVAFAIATGLAALVSIATIFNVVRSFSKVKASMPPPGDDNGHGLNLYGCYRKTQVHFIFIILFLLGCLATFTLATAKLMLLGKIEGSVDLLSIAFAVQALTFLSALLASRSLMENTVTIFEEKEADMAVNEWDPKL
ncbi:hypothetical protein FPRO06_08343 [Fusarium proliferatum]|uniref:Uncharacterized protein n=1 Tax=Gibberella intermedia TaxID=948311 RepID=A0A420S6V1_GIBIN|nr:hypothetical protein FPRO06_08343 [Fusarium proliferatum]KAI1050344.1 hypothetical protein LB506_001542 [Fusarium annulatum]RKL24985.1 hypothetical protein BFJ72_g14174 [Fusarium proliferatum]CVL00191.1 uncharacterized protein FPRN_09179 [Fusarium proliferatum]